jgi:gamma-glutamyltranspeptidase / glutathione hydrolase
MRHTILFLIACAQTILWLGGCGGGTHHTFPTAAVAADHAIASRAGAEILRQGGNAVDAAVATSFTLSVVRPYSCGIGGGGFMIIHFSGPGLDRLQRLGKSAPQSVALNYREQAPAAITPDFFETSSDPHASTKGGAAVAIPGTVAGLLHALNRYGTLERAAVLAPAIRAAEEGFLVDEHYMTSVQEVIEAFDRTPAFKQRFAFVWDRYLKQGQVKIGDRIHVPEQARVLRLIADHGAAGFYSGPVAKAIAARIQADGGLLTEADLLSFELREMQPLRFEAFGRTFLTMPPPSSGGIAMAQALGIYAQLPRDTPAAAAHALVESFKHAFADRARYLGDPAFVEVPTERLLNRRNLEGRARRHSPTATLPSSDYGTPGAEPRAVGADGGTSHFCIVDATGSAVSCTETINLVFGSCLAIPEYGLILNNEMDDFTTRRGRSNAFGLRQSDANLPAPGKRPLSSMTPTIMLDPQGGVEALVGASGGPRIITSTVQCLLQTISVPQLHAGEILAAPRLHHQWLPDVVQFEAGVDADIQAGLRGRGHEVRPTESIGNVQMIRRAGNGRFGGSRGAGGWQAACDPRKGGVPAGY